MKSHGKFLAKLMSRRDVLRELFKFLVLALVTAFLVCTESHAAESTIRLFKENGKAVSDYNNQIKKIIEFSQQNQLPITVQFSKGLSFTVYNVNLGAQNLILDIGNRKVLRVRLTTYTPLKFWNALLNPTSMIDSLGNYIRGYKLLSAKGIPIPELTLFDGHEKEFLVIEKLNVEFLYSDYINSDFIKNIPESELNKIDNDFLYFAKKTALFRNFGDFNAGQLAYTKDRGWVLIDFSQTHELAGRIGGNIFEFDHYDKLSNEDAINSKGIREIIKKPGIPERLKNKVLKAIEEERHIQSYRLLFTPPKSCSELFEI